MANLEHGGFRSGGEESQERFTAALKTTDFRLLLNIYGRAHGLIKVSEEYRKRKRRDGD